MACETKGPNHAMERAADRSGSTFQMTSIPSDTRARPPSLIFFLAKW